MKAQAHNCNTIASIFGLDLLNKTERPETRVREMALEILKAIEQVESGG